MTLRGLQRGYRLVALLWLATCLAFLAVNGIALLVMAVTERNTAPPRPTFGIRAALERAHPDLGPSELDRLIEESSRGMMYEAFTQFREKPYNGRYVNVDPNGFRVSKEQGPWPPAREYFNVFVFGGSTAFNYGVADDETIASYLYERLTTARLAKPPRVYNFGRGAYYSSQELVLFERLLASGAVPDLAIFIDGLNDFFFKDDRPALTGWLEEQVDRQGEPAEPALSTLVRSLPAIQALGLLKGQPPRGPGIMSAPARQVAFDDPAVSAEVFHRYLANKTLIEAMSTSYHVGVLFVWQPIPLYKYNLDYHVHQGGFGGHEYSRFGYPRVAEQVRDHPPGDDFAWCADIQENVAELLYVDTVHYSPRMSAMVAKCIFDALQRRGFAQ